MESPPLTVTIVGAGIGGLAAAIAFRRNGHVVQVFEASEVKTEVGTGIGLQVNALRVLEHLGVDKVRLRGVSYDGMTTYDGKTGVARTGRWLLPGMETNKNLLCLRSDVHDELMRLALEENGLGPPVTLRLGCKIVDCDPQTGSVTLQNGDVVSSDVVIGADGLRSTVRTKILKETIHAPASGISCFRSLVPTARLRELPAEQTSWFTEGLSGLHGIVVPDSVFRMVVGYPCHSGELFNITALYADETQDDPTWSSSGSRAELLRTFHDLDPKFLALLSLIDEPILKWQLRALPLLPTWTSGRVALLGDAAHATLPTLGQGAACAIEEAAALGCLFPTGTSSAEAEVARRLEAYEALRKPRGEYINRESLAQVTEPEKRGLYFRSAEMQATLLQHDAIKEAREYYEQHLS